MLKDQGILHQASFILYLLISSFNIRYSIFPPTALLFVAFALCMFCLYSFMPLVMKVTSATSVNLGILTADLYSLFFGLFLFGYKVSK